MSYPVLLLHGALGSAAQLDSLKDSLSKNYKVYSLNFEGHGGRPITKGFSIDTFVENVLSFLSENQIDKVNIFGYSMGGYVALKLMSLHPNKVNKLITLGTKLNWSEESAQREVKMLNPDKIEEKVPAFAYYLQKLHHPNNWKEVLNNTASMMLNLAKGDKLVETDFNSIVNEVILLLGSEDKMVAQEETELVNSQLVNSSFQLVEGVEHPIDKVPLDRIAEILVNEF